MRKSRKRVSPFRAQRPALSRKRVSRKRVSRISSSRRRAPEARKRVSKRGSRRRRSRNYRMRSRTHPVPKCENLGRKACKKASHCKYKYIKNHPRGGKCERLSVTGPLSWMNLTRDFRNTPDDIRKYILKYIQKRKARFMDATPYLYGGHYGPSPYFYHTTKIDDKCMEYQEWHGTSINKFIIINELQEGDILFVGSEETVEEQDGSQNGFGFVVKSLGTLIFEYSDEVCSWIGHGGCGIRHIIQEGRERFGRYVTYKRALRELIEFCSVGVGRLSHCGIKWDDIPEDWCEHFECEEHDKCILPWVDIKGILGPPGQSFERHRNYLFFGQQPRSIYDSTDSDDHKRALKGAWEGKRGAICRSVEDGTNPYRIGEIWWPDDGEAAAAGNWSEFKPVNIRAPLAVDPELWEMPPVGLGYQGQTIIDSEGKRTKNWVPLLEKHEKTLVERNSE